MRTSSVVVYHSDPKCAEALAADLQNHFRSVALARSGDELRNSIPKHRAQVAIVDLEALPLRDVESLHREFDDTAIICTHRLADENLWTQALAAGADDCCCSGDVRSIVDSAVRQAPKVKVKIKAA